MAMANDESDPLLSSPLRRDVLVRSEQVLRVPFHLDFHEPVVIFSMEANSA
jgi:hypothetical protein